MTQPPDTPLRGDAAWRARIADVAKRNDAARKRGGERRAAAEAERLARQRAADVRERQSLPEQPPA